MKFYKIVQLITSLFLSVKAYAAELEKGEQRVNLPTLNNLAVQSLFTGKFTWQDLKNTLNKDILGEIVKNHIQPPKLDLELLKIFKENSEWRDPKGCIWCLDADISELELALYGNNWVSDCVLLEPVLGDYVFHEEGDKNFIYKNEILIVDGSYLTASSDIKSMKSIAQKIIPFSFRLK